MGDHVEPADRPLLHRFLGCLLGLATGDALGVAVEGSAPGTFSPVTSMIGGGPFGLAPGEWTDDTSMALCLAASLTERGWSPKDQMDRYWCWVRDGYMSSNGRCFSLGGTTKASLQYYLRTGDPLSSSENRRTAGNGSLMRLAPVAMFFSYDPALAVEKCGESSKTTHGAPQAVDACRYFGALLVAALAGVPKDELLTPARALAADRHESPLYHLGPDSGQGPEAYDVAGRAPSAGEPPFRHSVPNRLDPSVARVAGGSFLTREPPEIRGSGYVVDSLEAALWAFSRSTCFRDGALLAVNLGEDADTTAAIYGQIAGAHYGVDDIPPDWLRNLAMRPVLERYARALHRSAREHG